MITTPRTRLRRLWDEGKCGFGAFCNTPSSYSAEVFADEGYDFVCVDTQHGLIGYEAMWPMLQALRFSEATALVRVPDLLGGWAGKALDAGADGVIFPMIESAADAEAAVKQVRYAPHGRRSYGPIRASMLIEGSTSAVNEQVLCVAMIETVVGLDAADEICATEGIDAIYIGPADLAVSLGVERSEWFRAPKHLEAIERIRLAGERNNVPVGIHTSGAEQALGLQEQGFCMQTIVMDTVSIRTQAQQQLAIVRDANAGTQGVGTQGATDGISDGY